MAPILFARLTHSEPSSLHSVFSRAVADQVTKTTTDGAVLGHEHTVGVVLAAVLYFFYTISVIAAIIIQRRRRLRMKSMWSLLSVSWVLATCQLVTQFMEWHEAFHIASDPTLIYEGFSNYYYPTKNGFTVLAAACLHAVWLWRLHAIWTYKLKVLIGPIVILFIAAGCSIVATLDNTRQVLVGDSQPTPGIETWALIAYVAALLCAILVSILIISRIYWISLRTELRVLSVRKVPHALIEGGMLYTFMIFLVAVSYGLKKAGSPHITEPLCHALPMIMAITLTLIIMNLESDLAESPTDFIGVARPRMLQLGRDRNKKNLIVSWPVLVEPGDGNNSPVTAALDTGYIAQQTPRTPRSPRPSFGGGRERPRFGNDDREERGLATAGVERTFDRQLSVSGGSVGFPRARSRSPNPDRQAGFNAPRRSYTAGSGLGNDSPPRSHYPGAPMPHGV